MLNSTSKTTINNNSIIININKNYTGKNSKQKTQQISSVNLKQMDSDTDNDLLFEGIAGKK